MTMTVPNPQDLQGQVLYDASGREIGLIEGVYLDNETRAPEWAAVRLGPGALALVPLADASSADGGARVDYDLDTVRHAPFQLTALDNEVTEVTEQLLYRYYEGGGDAPSQTVEEAKEAVADVAAMARSEAAGVAATAKNQSAEVASTAKAKAADLAANAKDQAAGVVEAAKEETAEVVHVAAAEARDLVDTTRTELESQAETQLEQIAVSLHRLAGQALALARGNAAQAGSLGDLVRRAGEELQDVAADIDGKGSAGLLTDAQRAVRRRPRAAILGTAAAVVAGARLMGTPAGDRLKERLAPLKDHAIEAGKSVAEELKPIAQERAERVRAVATQAAEEVRQDAEGAVQNVKGTARQSTRAVKGTAKRSASTVKGTAKQSTSTVTTTAKRTARAVAPAG